jgi:phage tail-like protein
MSTDPRKIYPLPKFHFQADLGNGIRLGFTKITGLEVATTVIEYREGNSLKYNTTKQPGRTVYGNIFLQRGVFLGDFDFFKWWKNTYYFQEGNATYRRDVTIQLLDEQHSPVLTWVLANAWPCRVKWGELNALENTVLLEELEITHEGLTIIDAS